MADELEVRIDKWLWAARVFKTRALATEACRAGHVKLDGHAVKPARPVHMGEVFVVHTVALTRTVRVAGLSEKRVGAKVVASLLEDLTPPEEFERVRRSITEQVLARPRGAGRPTKRDRRRLDEWMP
jgi:ribosome-associated heat shock protein Hsp15